MWGENLHEMFFFIFWVLQRQKIQDEIFCLVVVFGALRVFNKRFEIHVKYQRVF